MRKFLSSPALAYVLIVILQLKVMWKIWDYADLIPDDTCFYYWFSHSFLQNGHLFFAWSPLYQLFCATIMYVSSDPLFWCVSQRLLCAGTLSVLTLAIMRRLIDTRIAWLVAAWFAVLPINFNSLYPGHIFFAIPHVVAWLTALLFPGSWGRGICLAVFLITACLVRTEVFISVAVFAAAVLWYEWRQHFKEPRDLFKKEVLVPYATSCAIAILIVLAVYSRSTVQFPELNAQYTARHVLNVGQIYAFGHKQRHPEWMKDPWTQYGDLTKPVFGASNVTAVAAVQANPEAVTEHLRWNLSLVPSGLQLMLFNCTAGSLNPDYVPVPIDPRYAVPLSWLAIVIAGAGLGVMYRERKDFLYPWLRKNSWALIAISSSCTLCVLLMITQRPRPSYLFPLSITLMGFYGLCIWRILRVPLSHRIGNLALCLLPLAVISFVPSFYVRHHASERPLLEYYSFLKPFAERIAYCRESVLVPSHSSELMAYIYGNCNGPFNNSCIAGREYSDGYLKTNNIGWLLLDEAGIQQASEFLQSARSNGWNIAALRNTHGNRLVLYTRTQPEFAVFGK
jgi:hypothetical protein